MLFFRYERDVLHDRGENVRDELGRALLQLLEKHRIGLVVDIGDRLLQVGWIVRVRRWLPWLLVVMVMLLRRVRAMVSIGVLSVDELVLVIVGLVRRRHHRRVGLVAQGKRDLVRHVRDTALLGDGLLLLLLLLLVLGLPTMTVTAMC